MDGRVFEWCQRLLACRSVTGEGTRDIMQLCAYELLKPHGLQPRLIASESEGSSQVNLVSLVRGREHNRAPLILNTHLDTVPPGDPAQWTESPRGPFVPSMVGDRIYGLGAADTKLDFIAKAFALIECGTPLRDVHLIATFGEEHGLVGAKELVSAGIVPEGALAFVGEPSHLQVVTAHKGLMVFQLDIQFEPYQAQQILPLYRLIFDGRSAHSSTPALGLNAIELAIKAVHQRPGLHIASIVGGDAVNKVPARCEVGIGGEPVQPVANASRSLQASATVLEFVPAHVFSLFAMFVARLREFANNASPAEPDFAWPTLTCNLGLIRSSRDRVVAEFELRPPPSLPLDHVRDGLATIVADLSRLHSDLKMTLIERRANPGFRSPSESEAVELAVAALTAAHLPIECGVKAGCTEAGVYASAGIRPVVFGPGPSTGVIHAPNEYNLVTEVEKALRFYQQLLQL